jgi:nicotinamidase-related amidase
MPTTFQCPVDTYRQFDPADQAGWQRQSLEFSRAHTAVVVMHAWQPPAPNQLPGWVHAVPYLTRARHILRQVYPPLLTAVRTAGLPVFHVTGRAPEQSLNIPQVPTDSVSDTLHKFRTDKVFPGAENLADVEAGRQLRALAPEAQPLESEAIAETDDALHRLCQQHQINHLIYIGFAINWCLLMSPGGMVEMKRYGYLCSTVAEATAAVESRESSPHQGEYRQALWRTAVEFGFVFHDTDLIAALNSVSE